ncbi:MAG: SPOR domain-containing protein [Bacteroidota bacterium]|nr:SPOR domain-containing protein [Rhodothermia bacterium]MCS7155084.1 SPOR domain-containing protein [Bacteroidota bacterium]MDW8138739.1 SPOR domain-containing protein [Bacteroidota bacterium]MDW8286074.1 SPOR domain-containing protein [Bacteroidota bacterium]
MRAEAWIHRLADLLGASPEEARAWLQARIEGLQAELRRTGQAHWPGLGWFRRTSEGALLFEPDPDLAQAVNDKYAGLEPLLVSESWELPDTIGEADSGEADSEEGSPTSPEWKQAQIYSEGLQQQGEVDFPREEAEETYTPIAWGGLSVEGPDRQGSAWSERPRYEPPPARLRMRNPAQISPRSPKGIPVWWLLGLGLLLAAVGTWWYFRGQHPGAPQAGPNVPPSVAEAPRALDLFSADTVRTDTLASVMAPSSAEPFRSERAVPDWLRRPVQAGAGGFTIVLASWPTEQEAQADRERLLRSGVEATILPAQTPIGRRFRLVIGQFPTRREAETRRRELIDRLGRSDAWIWRLVR